jgi:hypothetical protein
MKKLKKIYLVSFSQFRKLKIDIMNYLMKINYVILKLNLNKCKNFLFLPESPIFVNSAATSLIDNVIIEYCLFYFYSNK